MGNITVKDSYFDCKYEVSGETKLAIEAIAAALCENARAIMENAAAAKALAEAIKPPKTMLGLTIGSAGEAK